jgi:hypothetical protein
MRALQVGCEILSGWSRIDRRHVERIVAKQGGKLN